MRGLGAQNLDSARDMLARGMHGHHNGDDRVQEVRSRQVQPSQRFGNLALMLQPAKRTGPFARALHGKHRGSTPKRHNRAQTPF